MKYLSYLIVLICFISNNNVTAGLINEKITFFERPRHLQLFTRDQTDSAAVLIRGKVTESGFDSILVTVFKNGTFWKTDKSKLSYVNNRADFELSNKIHAELTEYSFKVELIGNENREQVLAVDSVVCGDAYILSGQSNSHYTWSDATYQNEFCRTFGVKTVSSNYYPYSESDTLWSLAQGFSELGAGVGTLGIYIQKYILEKNGIPSCLINGGTGGSVIVEHLPDASNRTDLNTIFGKLLYRVQKSDIKRIRAVIWHQGENDANSPNIKNYTNYFEQLYDAWVSDYNPEKVYLFQLHPNGSGNAQGRFREIQRTLPDSLDKPNLVLMSTTGLPGHDGLHYSHQGYRKMAEWVYNLIQADFYGSSDTLDIHPPNIKSARYDPQEQEIQLIFDNITYMVWPDDTLGAAMEDYFYLDGYYGLIADGRANRDSIILKLSALNFCNQITYLPDQYYNESYDVYNGPWLKNSRGIGALSFKNYEIKNPDKTVQVVKPNGGEIWKPNTQQTVQWTHTNLSNVKIEYSTNAGTEWHTIAEDVNADSDSLTWNTPDVSSAKCKIRISAMDDSVIADESNHTFAIYTKSITVLSPNGGEVWPASSTQTISWISSFVENKVQIKYSTDGGNSWSAVTRWAPVEDEQYEWEIPDKISSQCKIKINDLDDTSVFDLSDSTFSIISSIGINLKRNEIPDKFVLLQNYPNPFNPSTKISYSLPKSGFVLLLIYDMLGNEIQILENEFQKAGTYSVNFNASELSSGIYFYKLQVDGYLIETKKMMFLR